MSARFPTIKRIIATVALLLAIGVRAWGADAPDGGNKGEPSVDMNALVQIADFPREARVFANRAGFCIDLDSGDGRLAAEIAQKTHLYVFALAGNDSDCQKTRQSLDQTRLYGVRSTAVAGAGKTIPLPNGYGNLIVTGNYRETLDLKEVFRVLNPNGTAVIGGGKTDAGQLKSALDEAGIKDYQIIGSYAIVHGKMPEGIDEWTHFTPRPDNITYSRETTVRPPFRTQWLLAQPSYDDKAVQHAAVANGRIIFRADVAKPAPDRYYAFDSFNGALLWQRPVSKAHTNLRYALVDDVFYSTEGNIIVALDAVTGEKKKEYSEPGITWYWIAVQDGTLYCLGRDLKTAPTTQPALGASNVFRAFDLKSGASLWKHEFPFSVLMQSAALDTNGGLYFCTLEKTGTEKTGKGAAWCLNAKTGLERWHTEVGRMAGVYNDCTAAGFADGRYFVWCCVDEKGVQGTKSFDAKNGQLIRDYPGVRSWGEGLVVQLLFVGGRIYANTTAGHEPYRCFDIESGAQIADPNQEHARDHPGTASANCLYCGGEGFCVYDLLTGKTWSDPFIRFSDFADPYVAEGMFFHMPTVCHCPHAFGAPMALAPAGLDWTPPDVSEDMAARLVAGPALDAPLAEDQKGEWTHYRGNAGHTGETATAPKERLKSGWEQKLGGTLTPPSCGGGLAYVASRNGSVWGLDQATGEIRWKFLCGAGVRVTPAYGQGRVVFGSYDGWVYCLDAKTGQLAWKFRVAPEERYINTEGQMNSLWPSAAGVILDGKVAYCAAGLQSYDGTYLYALDLQSGKPVWAKRIGDLDQQGAPEGIMALTGDTLIVPVFSLKGTLAYRKTDGTLIPWYVGSRPIWCFGSEAIADGDVFFYGGARHGNDDHYSRPSAFNLMDAKTGWFYQPKSILKPPKEIAPICIAPVLGKETILGDGVGYDRAKMQEILQQDPTKSNDAAVWSLPLWPDAAEKTAALALAGGIALAAGDCADGNSQVVAFDARKDGKELSRVKVPGKILRNSLAVADGSVFVVTDDGTVHCLTGG